MNTDAQEADPNRPAIVAHATSLGQAEVIAAVLRAEGIDSAVYNANAAATLSHIPYAVNPRGIEVAVPADQAEQAREILSAGPPEELADAEEEPARDSSPEAAPSAEDYARYSLRCAVLSILLGPLVVLAIWYFLKSLRRLPGPGPARRAAVRYLWRAVPLVVLAVLLWGVVLWLLVAEIAPWSLWDYRGPVPSERA
jgi:hypothetical protein